uniref:UBA domain-containing protein n=1 Tax=Nelumbo nucifera TaxID=4432 RepID=A0A822Y9T0_NELNU|nr:TPA_asm: hypothetical protein HUJ06_030540 [Nelumbo nucifera]
MCNRLLRNLILYDCYRDKSERRSIQKCVWYAWILLVVFQLLMSNVSLLGHLCGILSGFAYTYGLFNYLLPGSSFYSAIESSSFLSTCVRRPKFILCTGGSTSGFIPTYSSQNTTPSFASGSIWRNLSSWIPHRESTPAQDNRFPGRGRTLDSGRNQAASDINSASTLQARLLDDSTLDHSSERAESGIGQRRSTVDGSATIGLDASDEQIQKLVAMGFDRTQAEVALAAADGDSNVAVEILMSQQG